MTLNNIFFMVASDILILTLNILVSQLDQPFRALHGVQGVPDIAEMAGSLVGALVRSLIQTNMGSSLPWMEISGP